jgi:hypothetical protein
MIIIASPTPSATPDGSELSPYSLPAALALAKPGDTVMLRGVFHEVLTLSKTYTSASPLTVRAHPDGATIDGQFKLPAMPADLGQTQTAPDGTKANYKPLVSVTGKFINVDGLVICNSQGRGIGVSNTSNVNLSNLTVEWSRNAGVHLHTVQNVVLYRVVNRHAGCYYQALRDPNLYNWPVAFNVLYSKNVRIEECESSDNWGEGLSLGRGTADSTVTRSTLSNNMALQLYLHRSERCQAVGNLVYCDGSGFISPGIVINNEDNFTGTVANHILVANNIIAGCAHNLGVWGNEASGATSQAIDFLLNTSVNSRDGGLLLRARGARGVRVIGNLFYEKVGPTAILDGAPVECTFERNAWLGQQPPASARSASDLTGVELVNADSVIAPVAYSTKAEAGIGAIDGAPEVDFYNRQRKAWTVGAIEFAAAVVEPPVILPPEPPEPPTLNETVELTLAIDLAPALALALREAVAAGKLRVSVNTGGVTVAGAVEDDDDSW